MPGKEIKGRSARANYRHGGRIGLKQGGAFLPLRGGVTTAKAFRGKEGFKESQALQNKLLKNFKKKIQKTPDKLISKPQKKKIIQEQTMKKRKYEVTGDKWRPLDYGAKAKGGKV